MIAEPSHPKGQTKPRTVRDALAGWNGRILKFVTKEGIVGFLTGIQVCAMFVAKRRSDPLAGLLGIS